MDGFLEKSQINHGDVKKYKKIKCITNNFSCSFCMNFLTNHIKINCKIHNFGFENFMQ
jgi:hypothetical protein